MNVDDTQHIVRLCETPGDLQATADTVDCQPVGCQSPEQVAGMASSEWVANCATNNSSPLNPSCEMMSTSTTPRRCSPIDVAASTSSQPDVGTTAVTSTSSVVLVNGRAISVTSDDTPIAQPSASAGSSRTPQLRSAASRLEAIGLSAPTLLTQKTTNGAPSSANVIGGSEADLKLGGFERRQSGWARLRRWRSHRERTTASRSPYCTPPDHWSPLGTEPALPPPIDKPCEQPPKSSQTAPSTTEIHRPSIRNTCGQYVREQLLSFSQPSDNRLSMKLFGSKNAFVREKLKRTAAASSPSGSSWLIHPCSNFR